MANLIQTLLLSEQEVSELLSIEEVMEVVESAFRENALGYAQMPPKVYLKFLKYNGDLRTMPSYLERKGVSSVKVVSSHPDNAKNFGLPTVMATILLVEPKNGQLLAIIGGRTITAMRTGAAGGIAAKYLAKKNPKTVSFIGTGVQAKSQLSALMSVFPSLQEIKAWDMSSTAKEAFVAETRNKKNKLKIVSANAAKDAVTETDIVVTTTPSTKPLILDSWVSNGIHFNCIGADAPLKEELDPAILKRSIIVVDNWEQASHSGEINVPVSKGIISKENIRAELGEIIAGNKLGRSSLNEITVFDSTGLAIQDTVTAELVYRKAINKKIGQFISL